MSEKTFDISLALVKKLIAQQFPEFANLTIQSVKIQGHDNRTFRLGPNMSIRMPTAKDYALKVPKEQVLLPQLKAHLTTAIPIPLKMGQPSIDYPFNFSIYQWIEGESANEIQIDDKGLEHLASTLAQFLKELQSIHTADGPKPGLHNWWRGAHISVYDKQARFQIEKLKDIIDSRKALALWENALKLKWQNQPVWIHGDFASGNILIKNGKLSGIIDFGGLGIGDPACDLVIAWTFLRGKSREIFKQKIDLDNDTWVRAQAWCLWKATFELCQLEDKSSLSARQQNHIIQEVLTESKRY
jgi:aminoglycoside phosphotransferase (APT) family kinase protein